MPCTDWHISCMTDSSLTSSAIGRGAGPTVSSTAPGRRELCRWPCARAHPATTFAVRRPFLQRAYAAGRRGATSLAVKVCTISPRRLKVSRRFALRGHERRCADEPIAAGALRAIKRCIGPLDPGDDTRRLLGGLGGAEADGA